MKKRCQDVETVADGRVPKSFISGWNGGSADHQLEGGASVVSAINVSKLG
jgi:hypothetical protein